MTDLQETRRESIAVAKYMPTQATYEEMIFLLSLKKRRMMRMVGSILVLLSGLQLFTKSPDYVHILLLGVLAIAGVYYILWSQFMHEVQGKKAYKKLLAQFGDAAHLPMLVQTYYPDRIEVHAEKSENIRTYAYSAIKEIRESATMAVFVFPKEMGVAVPKSAFLSGSAEEVTALIRNTYKIR